MTDQQQGYAGQAGLFDGNTPFNSAYFLVQQILGRVGTMKLVRVEAVTNEGELAPVGFVDVLPLVNLIDGLGNVTVQKTVFGLPYFRIQGGTNAVIMDPQVGDIGLCVISDRDISTVKEAREPSPPGSRRRFDIADGVYIGGILNGEPEQYVRFAEDQIELVSPTKITMTAPQIEINGALTASQGASITGDVSVNGGIDTTGTGDFGGEVTGNGIPLSTHRHGGVTAGAAQTGVPVP